MCQPTAGRARAGEMEKKNAFFLSRRVGRLRSEPSFYLAAGEGQSPLSASACGRAWLLSGGGRFPYPSGNGASGLPSRLPPVKPRRAATGSWLRHRLSRPESLLLVQTTLRQGWPLVLAQGRNVRSKCLCSCVLQFTRRRAVCCVFHRPTSRVIHRSG